MPEETRLWARKMRGQRILASETLPCDPACPEEALQELCRILDLPRPLWLGKHQREYDAFRRTAFTQEHFLEPIVFSRLEVELIQPDEKPRRGPRSPLTDA